MMLTFKRFMNFGNGPVACFEGNPFIEHQEVRLDERSLRLRIENMKKDGRRTDTEEQALAQMMELKRAAL